MKILAVFLILLTLFIGIAPQVAANQAPGSQVVAAPVRVAPIRYQWVAAAEVITAFPLVASAILLYFSRRRVTMVFVALLGIILGFLIALVPMVLMSSCSAALTCGMVRSMLVVSGSLVMVISFSILVMALQQKRVIA